MTSRTAFAATLALALALSTGTAAASDRALIVGIDLYPHVLVNGAPNQRNLSGAVNDARRMRDLAVDVFGYAPADVTFLSDLDATRDGILGAIRHELVERTKPGDRVLIYYAGHGAQVADDSGDEADDGLDEVLVPSDAAAELGAAEPQLDGVILDDEIEVALAGLAGRDVTVIVDACHSGTITRTAAAEAAGAYRPVRTLTPFGPAVLAPRMREMAAGARAARAKLPAAGARAIAGGPKLAVWTAVTSAQYALEDMSVGGSAGLFTSRFVRGLSDLAADANGNGVVTPAELIDYLRVETQLYCGRYDCLGQDPLPMLEAFDGYAGRSLVRRIGGETAVMADAGPGAAPAGATVVRHTGTAATDAATAVPSDLMPARGAPVAVAFEGGRPGRVGEPLAIRVTSPRAGRLVVLDRRDDGSVVQLYPNRFSLDFGEAGLVAAGATIRIPEEGAAFDLVADEPGAGTLTAFVVDPAVDVTALLAAHADLAPIADPAAYADALSSASTRAIVFKQMPGPTSDRRIEGATVSRGDLAYSVER
ncbi:caspase family protein [Oharaeibacter diazotrophicus]|uniref:Uncharacterized protein DUF4384 n=3 Tax=Oharaeibacter diazotrophicus TaxID=1920512 RepID=A0A4R6RLI5_9HYPH|nr:caspase family protein [Oharaeibacter diazotrophicus]TDP87513.1 uncharacterized protein DUF4384 [Oharaeibacter diazotrophicus]BBE70543.1 caspase domain protein [Pleomorphomonas sp. SM30]GLS77289.1 hypothetical protein GCM10007904_26260 [Oharaeibacter diazotrophicus]